MAPQKRSAAEAESLLVGVKAIIFDVEGTTTPISYVKDKLYTYARNEVERYLTEKWEDAETIKDVTALRELAKKDKEEGVDGVVEIPDDATKEKTLKATVDNVRWQMDKDRKTSELKQLQGHIWKEGYASGELKGEVFEDVPPMLRMLSEEGFTLYVFSSGSVESQKLLFANTQEGDMTDVFTDYFDLTTGSKTDAESYKKIAEQVRIPAEEILFLTDLPEEAEAAVSAGLRAALVIRPGNADLTDEHLQNFACIEQFDELYGDEDEEDLKRLHPDDNGEAEDDEDEEEVDEEVDEEDEGEGEEDDGEEGDDA